MLMIDPKRLQTERESRALTRVDLCRLSGINDRTIEALEKGRRNANPPTIRALADALELKPLDIASVVSDA